MPRTILGSRNDISMNMTGKVYALLILMYEMDNKKNHVIMQVSINFMENSKTRKQPKRDLKKSILYSFAGKTFLWK